MSSRPPDPALRRALLAAREKREERGALGDGTVVTPPLAPDEALALDGLLSSRRPVLPGRPLRIELSRFESALRQSAIDPRAAYELVGDGPLRDRVAERAAARQGRNDLRSWLEAHPTVRAHARVGAWLDQAIVQGRIRSDTKPLVAAALAILERLPTSEPIQRTVLAATAVAGDPHGLDPDTPLHRLTLSLLAAADGLDETTPARELWARWNVIVDPVSSYVAVLNLVALDDGLVAQLLGAGRGSHIVLTHGQLAASTPRWAPRLDVFSCENPSVLIAAEAMLGEASAPLICTGGRPSDAVRLLLASLRKGGARIHHHGDYDLAGVQIFRDLEARYAAVPWQFDPPTLRGVVARLGRGVPNDASTTLEGLIRDLPGGVPEELVVDQLMPDLRLTRADSNV